MPVSLRERIEVSLLKTVMVSDRYEDAVELIVDLAKNNVDAGISMAEQYIEAWARRHDPHIPEAIRRQHQLPDDARIAVTPMMMEKSVYLLHRTVEPESRFKISVSALQRNTTMSFLINSVRSNRPRHSAALHRAAWA